MVQLLLKYGADPFAKYKENDDINTPAIYTVFEKLVSKKSNACKALMNSFINTNGQALDSSGLLIVYDLGLFHNESIALDIIPNEMAAHSKLIQSTDRDILKHPLSEIMLDLKKKRVFKYFFANTVLYVIFLLSLSILAFLQTMYLKDFDQEDAIVNGQNNTTHYRCTYQNDWRNSNRTNTCNLWYDSQLRAKVFGSQDLKCGMIFLNYWNHTSKTPFCDESFTASKFAAFYFFYALTSLSSVILVIVGWLKFCSSSQEYFRTKRYILEVLVLVSTVGYLIGMFLCSRVVNLHLGAWSVFMAWINMTILLGHFPGVGVYMFMFKYVTQSIIIYLLVYLPLLVAFAFGFYVLLPRNPSFNDPITSLLKVLSMMIGELEYADNFTVDTSKQPSDWTIGSLQIFFTLFVVLISIIIHNLILGLTVSEVDVLFKTARSIQLEHLVRQVS